MQLYKGLDVITNKVTEEEKGGIEHWGLDVVQPGEGGSWELGKWCTEADKKVSVGLNYAIGEKMLE
jgi:tRNA A37 N6-isopentenylltransferase MiaA